MWRHSYQNPDISINTIVALQNKTEDNDSSNAAEIKLMLWQLGVVGLDTLCVRMYVGSYYPRYRRQEIFPANPISGLWLGCGPTENRIDCLPVEYRRVLCKLYAKTELDPGFNPESIDSVLRIATSQQYQQIQLCMIRFHRI